jgi:hypothetical protein
MQQQQQHRQLDRYGFHWRSNRCSQQLVVLGELPEYWLQQQDEEAQRLLSTDEAGITQQQQQRRRPRQQRFKNLKNLYAGDKVEWWRIAEPAAVEAAQLAAQQAALDDLQAALAGTDDAAVGSGSADCIESDEEFYTAAVAGAGMRAYTVQDAPVRRFYQVGFLEPESQPWAVLEPVALTTRRGMPELLRYARLCSLGSLRGMHAWLLSPGFSCFLQGACWSVLVCLPSAFVTNLIAYLSNTP